MTTLRRSGSGPTRRPILSRPHRLNSYGVSPGDAGHPLPSAAALTEPATQARRSPDTPGGFSRRLDRSLVAAQGLLRGLTHARGGARELQRRLPEEPAGRHPQPGAQPGEGREVGLRATFATRLDHVLLAVDGQCWSCRVPRAVPTARMHLSGRRCCGITNRVTADPARRRPWYWDPAPAVIATIRAVARSSASSSPVCAPDTRCGFLGLEPGGARAVRHPGSVVLGDRVCARASRAPDRPDVGAVRRHPASARPRPRQIPKSGWGSTPVTRGRYVASGAMAPAGRDAA
jgi:hypothetical protein